MAHQLQVLQKLSAHRAIQVIHFLTSQNANRNMTVSAYSENSQPRHPQITRTCKKTEVVEYNTMSKFSMGAHKYYFCSENMALSAGMVDTSWPFLLSRGDKTTVKYKFKFKFIEQQMAKSHLQCGKLVRLVENNLAENMCKEKNKQHAEQCAENCNKWHTEFFLNCNQHYGNFKP